LGEFEKPETKSRVCITVEKHTEYTKLVSVISSCIAIKMLSKNTGFSHLKCQLRRKKIDTACFGGFSKFQPTRVWINKVNESSFQRKNVFKFVLA